MPFLTRKLSTIAVPSHKEATTATAKGRNDDSSSYNTYSRGEKTSSSPSSSSASSFDPQEHYCDCQRLYRLANELQKKKHLRQNDRTYIKLRNQVKKVGEGCTLAFRSNHCKVEKDCIGCGCGPCADINNNCKSNANKRNKMKHGGRWRKRRKVAPLPTFDVLYMEILRDQFCFRDFDYQMGRLVAELNETNKTNSLHTLKRITNEVRNPCDLDRDMYRNLNE